MPKMTKLVEGDIQKHYRGVKRMLDIVGEKWGKKAGDVCIAYHEDITVYAVRQWLTRPIPSRHWEALSRVSGLSLDEVKEIAQGAWKEIPITVKKRRPAYHRAD